jgi:hypothetical protein
VIYDVLYEHELTAEKLRPYSAVALIDADLVRDRAVKALEEYMSGGGKVIAIGEALTRDEKGRPRPQPSFIRTKTGKGESTYFEKLPPIDELAQTLIAADRPPQVSVIVPKGVLYNCVSQPKAGRVIVHLLNYTPRPVQSIQVRAQGRFSGIRLLSPDDSPEPVRLAASPGGTTEVQVPSLKIYSILVLERAAKQLHSERTALVVEGWSHDR